MEIEWGLFHDYHVKLSTHLPKESCHLLFAPNLGCVGTNAWKLFPLGGGGLGTHAPVAAHCTCCLVHEGCVSNSLPSLSALSLCLFLSVFPLFLYYLQNGNRAVHACACSLQKGKIPQLLHFFTPVSLSPVCHSINLDMELAPRSCPLGTTECDIIWKWSLCRYE